MHTCRFVVALLLLATPMSAQDRAGRIRGRVADREGTAVAGAVVTVRGGGTSTTFADEDGRFVLDDLPAGTYTVTARADGFSDAASTIVLSASTTRGVDLTLTPACVTTARGGSDFGIATNITAADAVIYVRIRDAGKRARLTDGDFCVDGHEHQAEVLGIVKAPAHMAATIRLIRSGAQAYRNGDRYILFVHTHRSGAFVDLGDNAFQVQNGRVHWTRSDLPGVADNAPVERVIAALQNTLAMTR